ncbi:hypothetical protein PACTADRAFT_33597 [Pachysolen tannophilus NRRL Y-2460]|uniref:RING-type domain-containing protein n=1 Tax=Pachysolen tannophilus NRRL Y-2460 TaxID=669874 RepID=A0A1E4TXN6_PACTA|nr:hypothetical protein PACTADRAFT_33597 [Pachysolen tannophilus NRRL Y-2460]
MNTLSTEKTRNSTTNTTPTSITTASPTTSSRLLKKTNFKRMSRQILFGPSKIRSSKKRPKVPQALQLNTPQTTSRSNFGSVGSNNSITWDDDNFFSKDSSHFDGNITPLNGGGMSIAKNSKVSYREARCCLCLDLLAYSLQDETPPIELTCGHQSHSECLLLSLDKYDIDYRPDCPICHLPAQFADRVTEETVIQELLIRTMEDIADGNNILEVITETAPSDLQKNPMEPDFFVESYPTTPDSFKHDGDEIFDSYPKTPSEARTLDPLVCNTNYTKSGSSNPFNDDIPSASQISASEMLFEEISNPSVSFLPEIPKIKLSENAIQKQSLYELECIINVTGPAFQAPEVNDSNNTASAKKSVIDGIINDLKSRILDWKGISFDSLGELIIFDFLKISDGTDWYLAQCYLFENILLMVNEDGTSINGTVMVKEHISSVVETDKRIGSIMLNLKEDSLPILYISSENRIINQKWFKYLSQIHKLSKAKTEFNLKIPLIQISTNAWSLVKDKDLLPKEVILFNQLTEKGLDLPINILKKSIPAPERLPMVLMISVSLINFSSPDNSKNYLSNLKKFLRTTLANLQDCDRVGLIFVGRNGLGQKAKNAIFIGTLRPSLTEWDRIINDLKVFDNIGDNEVPILENSYEELYIALHNCQLLISTIFDWADQQKTIKKILIVTNSSFENCDENGNYISSLETKLKDVIKNLFLEYEFSITSILLRNNYEEHFLNYLNKVSMDICYNDKLNNITVIKGFQFLRCDNFDELIKFVPKLIETFTKITIPKLHIKMRSLTPLIHFDKIESTNGELAKLKVGHDEDKDTDADTDNNDKGKDKDKDGHHSAITELDLIIHDIDIGFNKSLSLGLNIDLKKFEATQKLNPEGGFSVLPLIEFQSRWLDGLQSKISKSSIKLDLVKNFTDQQQQQLTSLNQALNISTRSNNFSPVANSNGEINASTDYMDIPVLPPISSQREVLFVKRQIELIMVNSLHRSIQLAMAHQPAAARSCLLEMISLTWGIVKSCNCDAVVNPNTGMRLVQYIDKWSKEISAIGDEYTTDNTNKNNSISNVRPFDAVFSLLLQAEVSSAVV